MKGLTERQMEIARFIEQYFDDNGYAPSLRDIGNHFGFSPKAAYDHLRALERKGIVKTADNLPRGMALLKRTTPESGTIIKKTNHAENGEIVAASIGESEEYGITLKHFYRIGDRYELHPANSQYKVMVSTHCEIYGKLLMIIRQYGR